MLIDTLTPNTKRYQSIYHTPTVVQQITTEIDSEDKLVQNIQRNNQKKKSEFPKIYKKCNS